MGIVKVYCQDKHGVLVVLKGFLVTSRLTKVAAFVSVIGSKDNWRQLMTALTTKPLLTMNFNFVDCLHEIIDGNTILELLVDDKTHLL